MPRLDQPGHREQAEHGGRRPHRRLRDRQDAALRVAVGDDAGERREQEDREELQAGREAEGAGAAGEREDEPVLGDALHPRADVGHEGARREQPVVADAERGERRPHVAARRSSSGATWWRSASSSASSVPRRWASQASRRAAIVGEHVAGGGGELDDDLAPVGVVRSPGDQPGLLEAGDGAGHRRWLHLLGRGELTDRQRTPTVERAEHGELVERAVVAAALEAQPARQPHHAEAERAGEGSIGDGHILSLTHYLC